MCNLVNILATIVRHLASSIDAIQSILNYLQAFPANNALRLASVRVLDIIDETLSSDFLPADVNDTYVR